MNEVPNEEYVVQTVEIDPQSEYKKFDASILVDLMWETDPTSDDYYNLLKTYYEDDRYLHNVEFSDSNPNFDLLDIKRNEDGNWYLGMKSSDIETYNKSVISNWGNITKTNFNTHVQNWNDLEYAEIYDQKIEELTLKYGEPPTKIIGFLEDSPELYQDILSASEETGADPNLLYLVYMQEGGMQDELIQQLRGEVFSHEGKNLYKGDSYLDLEEHFFIKNNGERLYPPVYKGDYYLDTGGSRKFGIAHTQYIGFEGLLGKDHNLARKRNYLKSDINVKNVRYWEYGDETRDFTYTRAIPENWDNVRNTVGDITMKDALRGSGALIRLHEDYLRNYFKDNEIDLDNLPSNIKTFWTYASINAGPETTKEMFDYHGLKPWENEDFWIHFDEEYDEWEDRETGDYWGGNISWKQNITRLVGGLELLEIYDPFSKNDPNEQETEDPFDIIKDKDLFGE
jgi:hypothetical protein